MTNLEHFIIHLGQTNSISKKIVYAHLDYVCGLLNEDLAFDFRDGLSAYYESDMTIFEFEPYVVTLSKILKTVRILGKGYDVSTSVARWLKNALNLNVMCQTLARMEWEKIMLAQDTPPTDSQQTLIHDWDEYAGGRLLKMDFEKTIVSNFLA